MRRTPIPQPWPFADPPLSCDEVIALKKACGPVEMISFPPIEVIRTLRQYGYVRLVLGGLEITDSGLERLVRERDRARSDASSFRNPGGGLRQPPWSG